MTPVHVEFVPEVPVLNVPFALKLMGRLEVSAFKACKVPPALENTTPEEEELNPLLVTARVPNKVMVVAPV